MRNESKRKRSVVLDTASFNKQLHSYESMIIGDQLRKPQKNYKFYIGAGNNGGLIRKVLLSRQNWSQTKDQASPQLNLRWQQTNKAYNYEQCNKRKLGNKLMLNHHQFHQQLSNKEKMLNNLMDFCQSHKMNAFQYVPVTFVLNLADSNFENVQNQFIKFYEANLPEDMQEKGRKKWLDIPRKNHTKKTQKKYNYHYCRPYIKDAYMTVDSAYLWILKPAFYNRGQGIHIFNKITSLENLLNLYLKNSQPQKTPHKNDSGQGSKTEISRKFRVREVASLSQVKTYSFVVQKYLERPFLIDGRKFDIRVWALVTHQLKVFFYREGYIRTSSKLYSASSDQLQDISIHLTNNAIQKKLDGYGKFQEGNQLSFKHFQKYLEKYGGDLQQILSEMKKIIKMTVLSGKKKLDKANRRSCFELFGYDFMLDRTLKVWLIEINTNPCLDESSQILQKLLPKMIDGMFKLTIDEIFVQDSHEQMKEQQQNSQWDFVIDLQKSSVAL